MRHIFVTIFLFLTVICQAQHIDRKGVVVRNNPHVTTADTLSSLSVGNGHFATTVDVTGLQSFPERYENGIPLCAMSDWGWHSYPNVKNLKPEETQKSVDLGHGHEEVYAVEYKTPGRGKEATEYFRVNPHRLNLGNIGFVFYNTKKKDTKLSLSDIQNVNQTLNLYYGIISSKYTVNNYGVEVATASLPDKSALVFSAKSQLFKKSLADIVLRLPYPTGKHADAASDWKDNELHTSKIVEQGKNYAIIEHDIDATTYFVRLSWEGKAKLAADAQTHTYTLSPKEENISVRVEYAADKSKMENVFSFADDLDAVASFWNEWWQKGAIVDFSQCTDPRAKEVERRTVLSQYLTFINCANDTPPQETGLTYNSWFGRPHLEMTWWHLVDFSLWNRPEVLKKIMDWYTDVAYPYAKEIAERQHFKGVRWMKMTDPWVGESPSNVGSYLTWQQPHYIYMAEELYRRTKDSKALSMTSEDVLSRYGKCVEETAEFLADFAQACATDSTDEICLFGQTAMQESMSKDFSFCQPFEQAYFVYGLKTAQTWRERQGLARHKDWDDIIKRMASLADNADSIYVSGLSTKELVKTADDSFALKPDPVFTEKCRSDHPAVLGACGLLPDYNLYDKEEMARTMAWIFDNWNWDTTWGWDYGMTAMCAARLGDGESALRALLIDKGKNTYLVSGHNFQEPKRLRLYLPGNGAFLDAIAMMCAGWDGCPKIKNPGFPQDGKWNVRWEGLNPMQ